MITLSDKLEAAQAEVARNLREIAILKLDVKNYAEQADAALARLAEIESTHIDEVMNGLMLEKALANLQAQEPVGTVDRTAPGFVAWVGIPKLKDGAKLFAAAGASPVQTSQAVVVEPVYQYQLANGNWIDQTKENYDYNAKHGQATVRMLYATPQAAPLYAKEQQ